MLTRIADDLYSIAAESAAYAQALADHLRASGRWIDVVPGIDSVVVRFDAGGTGSDSAGDLIERACAEFVYAARSDGQVVEVPVQYGGKNGPDLAQICSELGISESDFITQHTAQDYPVEMVGFTPGFAFIGGLQEALRVPRRSDPRPLVPAGSVAVADSRTGLYAMQSPGGWNLVGRTELTLFDPEANEPFVLSPGMRVRFVAS